MAHYILDTNILSYLIDINSPMHNRIKVFFSSLKDTDFLSTTIITIMELNYALQVLSSQNLKHNFSIALKNIESNLNIYSIDLTTTKIFSDLKYMYKKQIGINSITAKKNDLDLIIASISIEKDAILVSNDKIFKTISETSKLNHISI